LEPGPEDADVAMPVGCVRIFNGGQKITCCRTGASLVAAPFISLLHAMHLTPRRILLAPQADEAGVDINARLLAALLREAECLEGKPIDVLCGACRRGAVLAQQLERLVPRKSALVGHGETDPGAPPPRVHHQPRAILTLRALQTRDTGAREVFGEESYSDLVRRMRSEIILLIERLPRSVLVICPGEDVRRVLVAHFLGCEEGSIAEMALPQSRVLELSRDHKGFHAQEVAWPDDDPLIKCVPASPVSRH